MREELKALFKTNNPQPKEFTKDETETGEKQTTQINSPDKT